LKTEIFLVRHGETNWNKARKFQGMTDIPLNELGRRQAMYAHEALKDIKIDVAFASPLSRAQETARIILEGHGIELITEDELHEQNAGDWEGLTAAEIEEKFPGQHELWTNKPTELFIQNKARNLNFKILAFLLFILLFRIVWTFFCNLNVVWVRFD